MNSSNRHLQPFAIVFITLTILLVVSQFKTEFNFVDFNTKPIKPIADILLTATAKKTPLPTPILNDSIVAKDSISVAQRATDSANILDYETDSTSALEHFFKSLNTTRKQKHKTRIAYFGDSMIEGDLISQDFRSLLQDAFGGEGVGFVPITSLVAGFRTSIQHSFDGWTTYNLLGDIPSNHSLGISGYSFIPQYSQAIDTTNSSNSSWVKYTAVNKKHGDKFYNFKLLYGKTEGVNYVSVNGKNYNLNGNNAVNQLEINSNKPLHSINARFICKNSFDVFGASIESDSGVFVDNFSFRGNSGIPILKVPSNIYKQTNKCLNYDLIILGYGLNAVSAKVTDFSWYTHSMNNVIRQMRENFPNASFLLVSVGDKGYRDNGISVTDPSVPILVKAQKEMAKKNNIAFWSLYDAMGGEGSMIKWVECDTPLANKDYAHFNFKGAHKVGKLFFEKLMSEYTDYNKKH